MIVSFESPGVRETIKSESRYKPLNCQAIEQGRSWDLLVPGSGGKHLMKCRISVAAEEAPVLWIEVPLGKAEEMFKDQEIIKDREREK